MIMTLKTGLMVAEYSVLSSQESIIFKIYLNEKQYYCSYCIFSSNKCSLGETLLSKKIKIIM